MYVVLSLIVIILTILITWFVKKQRYMESCLKKFPGPKNEFFFGCAKDFIGDKGMLVVLLKYQKKYGDLVYCRLGPNIHSLVVTNPNFEKTILLANTNLSKGNAYDHIKCWLGEGLLTSSEEQWRAQRKMITPAFSNQSLIHFISVFDHQSNILRNKIKTIAPVNSVNLHSYLNQCSIDIICETTMGVSMNAQEKKNTDYVESVKEMCRIVAVRSLSIWKPFMLLFMFTKEYRQQRKCLKVLHGFTDKVICERKKQRKLERLNGASEKPKKSLALLDILLDYSENEKLLSEEEIRQEVHTFMFAGHDTVTAAMEFCLYQISKYPKIQETVYLEQKTIFGNDISRETTLHDIQEMVYLEMVIKETMRMYPSVPIYTRIVTKEFSYEGKVIPEGAMLFNFAYGLHRNEKFFPNPEEFDPSRFEDVNAQTSYSYLPFSTGPRNCIGQKFAMYEMKVVLSKLIRYFEFLPAEPEHNLDIRAEVVLLSRTGVHVKILPR